MISAIQNYIRLFLLQNVHMGNQQIKQATRYRNRTIQPRNNFSLQVNNKKDNQAMLAYEGKSGSPQTNRKKSSNITAFDDEILRYLNQSKQTQAKPKLANNREFSTLDPKGSLDVEVKRSHPQRDRALANLSRKNEELRRELKLINEKLSQKLKRKKLVPKKKQEEQEENGQERKQMEARAAGMRRQLENGYKQIDMYKRTLLQLNAKEETKVSHTKVKEMQNQVAQLDRLISQTMKKLQGLKNIQKNQQRSLQHDINQDLIDNLQLLKKEQEQIKSKIKEINKKNQLREANYKKQQAYLFQVQKKYRQMLNKYFPQLKKKKLTDMSPAKDSKKPSTFDKYSTPNKSKEESYPTEFQITATTTQLNQLRARHEEYHRKIDAQLQIKNKTTEEIAKLDQEITSKDRIIESLKLKLVEIRKIIRPNKKSLFGYDSYEGSELVSEDGGVSEAQKEIQQQHQQDQFDIKHLIANIPKPIRLKPVEMQRNSSIKSGQSGNSKPPGDGKGMVITGQKSQPKVWGTTLTRKEEKGKFFKNQLAFDDSVQFQNSQVQPLIIGINGWVNKNGDVLAIQAIYLNKEQIRYGVKSSNSADGFIVRYDLQAPDYLKNISGGFNQAGVLEYIAFYSKKGKSGTFGNKRDNQQSFTFGLASNQRPFRLNGATIMVDSEPRLCRLGIEICTQ